MTVVPIRGIYESKHALLAELMEDDTIAGVLCIGIHKDGEFSIKATSIKNSELSYAGSIIGWELHKRMSDEKA